MNPFHDAARRRSETWTGRASARFASGALALILAAGAYAAMHSERALMTQAGCFSCHAVRVRKVGPAFSWIAYRSRGQRGAVARLAHKVITGGTGYWAAWTYDTPMAAHPDLSITRAEAMVRWVLARPRIKPPAP